MSTVTSEFLSTVADVPGINQAEWAWPDGAITLAGDVAECAMGPNGASAYLRLLGQATEVETVVTSRTLRLKCYASAPGAMIIGVYSIRSGVQSTDLLVDTPVTLTAYATAWYEIEDPNVWTVAATNAATSGYVLILNTDDTSPIVTVQIDYSETISEVVVTEVEVANLGTIIQMAMDISDAPTATSSGKYSLAWWTRLVNQAVGKLAEHTGYNISRFPVAITANTQVATKPTLLCWGIVGGFWGKSPVTGISPSMLDVKYPGWRYMSEFPNQDAGAVVKATSDSALDITQTVTAYGTKLSTRARTSAVATITGLSAATLAGETAWGDIHYIELSAACVGDVTVATAVGATIAVIEAGDTSAGSDITTNDAPLYVALEGANVLVYPMTEANGTLWLVGGLWPTDLTTASSLSDSQTITGLDFAFYDIVAEGAAALSEITNLDDESGRANIHSQAFWSGVDRVKMATQNRQLDRTDSLQVGDSFGWGFYNR